MSEATSPEAWPPIPSATTKSDNFLSTKKLSSLASRLRPTSVAAQKLNSMPGTSVWDPATRNLLGCYHERANDGRVTEAISDGTRVTSGRPAGAAAAGPQTCGPFFKKRARV